MRGGQQQLEDLQAEVEARDQLVGELREEVEGQRRAAAERERQLEAGWETRERQAQAEVAAKVQVGGL